MGYQLTEAEERLAEILWKHVPMSSAELVKICGEGNRLEEVDHLYHAEKAGAKRGLCQ